jgi:hypothetical protein
MFDIRKLTLIRSAPSRRQPKTHLSWNPSHQGEPPGRNTNWINTRASSIKENSLCPLADRQAARYGVSQDQLQERHDCQWLA